MAIPPPTPGVPFDIPYAGVQMNLTGAASPYTMNMPAGVDSAIPTGIRNVSDAILAVTFNAAAGQYFWDYRTQTQVATTIMIIEEGGSAMFVYFADLGWAPFLVEPATITELWAATPIVGIGVPSVIQWTFQPLFPAQTPYFYTEAAGVFTYAPGISLSTDVSITVEMDFNAAAGNTDATYSVDF
ncbi:unnamed protein product, partial [marine sediment metagenome]